MSVKTLTIDGKAVTGDEDQTILSLADEVGISIPRLCFLEGLGLIGACRLCVVEIEGTPKLQPACLTVVQEGMVVRTDTEKLRAYRRQIIELLFAERNHHCAICVSSGFCELQDLAYSVGMDNCRYPYQSPSLGIDATHRRFAVDHNRCVLCARCVRVCDEIEGAHTWDLRGRGASTQVITDLAGQWGDSQTCTTCGKCVHVCPTGALFELIRTQAEMIKNRDFLVYLKTAREKRIWIR